MARTVERRILSDDPRAKAGNIFETPGTLIEPENPDHAWIDKLPMVLPPFRSLRFEPFTGYLHLASYHKKAATPDIDYKRWSPHTSLESVTGVSAEMVDKYSDGGDVVGRTLELYRFVNESLREFGDNSVTDPQIADLHEEAEQRLADLGFSTARKPSKTEIAKQVGAGINFDKLDRRNPLISRARLASSLMKLLVEQRFENEVLKKYFNLFFRLLGEQQLEEAYVQSILAELTQGNFTPDILKKAFRLQTVKAAPFRLPVMQAYITQFGGTDLENRMYFEDDPIQMEALNDSSIDLDERRARVVKNLKTALADGESIYSV